MPAPETEWEEFPSYSDLFHSIKAVLAKIYEVFLDKKAEHVVEYTGTYNNINKEDIIVVALFAIIWTILRHLATESIFKPLASRCGLTSANQRKVPESAWRFIYYLCAWCYVFYVLIWSGRHQIFQKQCSMWNDWSLKATVSLDIYLLYMAQWGFYVHSLYTAVFQDTWRKDSLLVVIHHVVTLLLISFSYSLRYHKIGTLLFLTHDICEVAFEFTKLNVYFKIQRGKVITWHKVLADISFVCFVVVWFVGRLYCFPLRVLYASSFCILKLNFLLPYFHLMNGFAWVLQIMNIYWSFCILKLIYNVATSQMEVEDIREYEVDKKSKPPSKRNLD